MPYLEENNKTSISIQSHKRALHKGNYQLPIYCGYPEDKGKLTYENFVSLERIPCAAMLVRVHFSAIDYDGNFISITSSDPQIRELAYEKPPEEAGGAYSTAYYITTKSDRDLVTIRNDRNIDAPLVQILEAICDILGVSESVDTQDNAKLLEYFKKRINQAQAKATLLDSTFFSAYSPPLGFRFNIEAIYGCSFQDSILSTLISVVPPGAPYN